LRPSGLKCRHIYQFLSEAFDDYQENLNDMNKAFRLLLCLCLLATLWVQALLRAEAQESNDRFIQVAQDINALSVTNWPKISSHNFTSLIFPTLRQDHVLPPLIFTHDMAAMLENAISKRLGIRYRFYGKDDRGYDCSGFVWRVFQDAGADFERVAARTLWRQLPEASHEDTKRFGTLVFFNGLKHVGIVRDAYSFYHASRSQGVTVSFFDGYWGRRVTGYRRAPTPILPQQLIINN
jgi:hypothetical protein